MKNLVDIRVQSKNTLAEIIQIGHNPSRKNSEIGIKPQLAEILFISSYPPRECGIATYSQDLVIALKRKFDRSFTFSICALESANELHDYSEDVKYILNTDTPGSFADIAASINQDQHIKMVMIQHEFGFYVKMENEFENFIHQLNKPVSIVFHTVLPGPDDGLRSRVVRISKLVNAIVVMTQSSAHILSRDYDIPNEKIWVIAHGTHLVKPAEKLELKVKYGLQDRKVLSTFGFLGSGKSIETTLNALPEIVKNHPDVIFLIIGKTHPSTLKREGEVYRNLLEEKVDTLNLRHNVLFVNSFLPLTNLLEYLQLTDIYLFTSKDPNQAVSGTFSYAISCGCPIISTPIPHAKEVLGNDAGIIIDFGNATQLTSAVTSLLNNDQLRNEIGLNGLHRMASTAWENSAISHVQLFQKFIEDDIAILYNLPEVNLSHILKLTTEFGMVQFSKIDQPDMDSGYTLDDNARAMIVMGQHYAWKREEKDLHHIGIYLNFISYCLQPDGSFLNYVDKDCHFTVQNQETNLEDANGRAIWSLGYIMSLRGILPNVLTEKASRILEEALVNVHRNHSTRAMAFVIKGLYYAGKSRPNETHLSLMTMLANRLVQMYRHEDEENWHWFESYLTYGNSILPEALLCTWFATGDQLYRDIAKRSFDFLLSKTFVGKSLNVISNKTWLHKGKEAVQKAIGGEQPIDVAYTIMALKKFSNAFENDEYFKKMKFSFNWFLGDNHLHQIIYNPCTGGCYDGLEELNVNLNQGAESTISYLMARLTLEQWWENDHWEKVGA